MKMEIDSQELAYYQGIAVDEMNRISSAYQFYCELYYKKASWWTKLKLMFKFPPSTQMYHVGEETLTGSTLRLCLDIRETWHCFWWVTNKMPHDNNSLQDNYKIYLDGFETEQIVQLKRFYKKDYENHRQRFDDRQISE